MATKRDETKQDPVPQESKTLDNTQDAEQAQPVANQAADSSVEQPVPAAVVDTGAKEQPKDENQGQKHQLLDQLEAAVNTLGSYAVSHLKPLIDQLRSVQ